MPLFLIKELARLVDIEATIDFITSQRISEHLWAITVNTNVSALVAQRNLSNASNMLNQSLERLASGNRINSAKDDAAGLQISKSTWKRK